MEGPLLTIPPGQTAVTCRARTLGLTNDVGLLSEDYDPIAKTLVGNFPQALSHAALVNAGRMLSR